VCNRNWERAGSRAGQGDFSLEVVKRRTWRIGMMNDVRRDELCGSWVWFLCECMVYVYVCACAFGSIPFKSFEGMRLLRTLPYCYY
jgi:hypothetical protein